MVSVITLAGAAELIFGELLRAKGREPSLELFKKAVVEIHQFLLLEEHRMPEEATPEELKEWAKDVADRANNARNRLKHWNPKTDSDLLKLDPAEEARDMLNRAIDNYWMLEQKLTDMMERFYRETYRRE